MGLATGARIVLTAAYRYLETDKRALSAAIGTTPNDHGHKDLHRG